MKAFTDLDQSKKLAKILPAGSADMCYIQNSPGGKYELCLGDVIPEKGQSKIPAWSLGALIDALPRIAKEESEALDKFRNKLYPIIKDLINDFNIYPNLDSDKIDAHVNSIENAVMDIVKEKINNPNKKK